MAVHIFEIQAGAVPRRPALYLPRPVARSAILTSWQSIALTAVRYRNLAVPSVLAASALGGSLAIWPLMTRHEITPSTVSLALVRNETVVVYRQAPLPQPDADQESSEHPYTEQVEASDEVEGDNVNIPSNFPRPVQIVRFVKPGSLPSPDIHEPIQRTAVKVEGVAFHPKEDATVADEKGPTLLRKRTASIMDQVDDYLWEVYQRASIKKDGTGDFTWKDPAAAKHMGLSLKDYVIGGMDAEFREQLYHAGRAMDAAGLQWSMLSAFRDDYRQSLASGYKASVSNSLHGGSRRTGGYGHGRAIDITGPDGRESDVWKWIDAHGTKYGLHRPLPGPDPAHVQQHGDWHKIALVLRESRTGTATAQKGKVAAAGSKAKVRENAVASAR